MTKQSIRSSIDFGHQIRQARKALKLTQPQLAGASGVGVRFIVDLEHGKPTCAIDKALHVAVMLGLKIHMSTPDSVTGNEKIS